MMNSVTRSRYNIEALTRGLEILSLFSSDKPSLSLMEVVAALKINKSTAYRVLSTLETLGYLERDANSRRYRPSLKVLELGFTALNSLEVRQVARPYLERLAQEVNETVSLGILDGMDVVYIDRVRNRSIVGVVLGVGSHVSAHCTALGKVLLAYLPQEELMNRLTQNKLTALTPCTFIEPSKLLDELELVRQRGYAINDEELAIGLRAIAAPIRDLSQKTVAAINVSGPVTTISLRRLKNELASAVVETATQISAALGYNLNSGAKNSGSGSSWRARD